MSRLRAIMLSTGLIVVVLLVQSASQAQSPDRGGRSGGRDRDRGDSRSSSSGRSSSPLRLLANRYVQEDLKLTDEQKADIKAISDRLEELQRQAFSRRGDDRSRTDNAPKQQATDNADANEKDDDSPKGKGRTSKNSSRAPVNIQSLDPRTRFALLERKRGEAESAAAEVLTKEQVERIRQIQIRQEGPMAVTKPAVQKQLKLTPNQSAQIEQIVGQSDMAQNMLRNMSRPNLDAFRTPDGGFNREAYEAQMNNPYVKAQVEQTRRMADRQREGLKGDVITLIGQVLTKRQRQLFQQIQGPPFDLAKLDRDYDPSKAAAQAKEEEAAKASAESKAEEDDSSKSKSRSRSERSR